MTLLAQTQPAAAAAAAPLDTNLVAMALAYIVAGAAVGWASKRILRWISGLFRRSPVIEALIAAVGRSLQYLIPAYTLFFYEARNPGLIPAQHEVLAGRAIELLVSLAHTASVFQMVAVPIAWAQKLAGQTDNKLDDVLVPMLATVTRIVVVLVGGVKAVSIIDPEISKSILGLLAAGGIGIAFASQDTLKNVFGAVMLIVDQPFTLGDVVNTGSHEGKVRALGLRSTTIELNDGQTLTIPNSDLANRPIVNLSRRDFIRSLELVHLETNTPAEKVLQAAEIVRKALEGHEGSDPRHPPLVSVLEFAEWSVNVRYIYWYYPADLRRQLDFHQRLTVRIAEKLQEAGIRLAVQGTPQQR
ncbi:MAG: mechanosensitive ion channel family protein [Verrucomicrobiota bacterium]